MLLPTVKTFVIESSRVGDRLEVSVALPPGWTAESDPLPVIYVLDPAFNS